MLKGSHNESGKIRKEKAHALIAEKMAELVLEAERVGAAQVGRREGIAPAQLSRWKEKFLRGGIANLKELKREPKAKEDPKLTELKAETERLQ